jgi:UDP-N-acetyl-2-amino-2-deoxyglucuronate dehydrogenase
MRFSIIGTGFIFPAHAEAIRHIGGKIRDVVNTGRGEKKWIEMVKTTDADCIVILTPNDLHLDMVNTAVEVGKIVLCEKPLGFNSEEVKLLIDKPNIFTVMQLQYHPDALALKNKISKDKQYEIEMDIAVHRDEKYYQSWKGQLKRSGGILFNLGVHYFNLLIYLFGEPTEINGVNYSDKTASGKFASENYSCSWKISTEAPKENQHRIFKVNGVNYNFSSKDNLSYENLHRELYKDLLLKRGVSPQDCLSSTLLIENIYKKAGVSLN